MKSSLLIILLSCAAFALPGKTINLVEHSGFGCLHLQVSDDSIYIDDAAGPRQTDTLFLLPGVSSNNIDTIIVTSASKGRLCCFCQSAYPGIEFKNDGVEAGWWISQIMDFRNETVCDTAIIKYTTSSFSGHFYWMPEETSIKTSFKPKTHFVFKPTRSNNSVSLLGRLFKNRSNLNQIIIKNGIKTIRF
jgi:hypothetical protein